jgi:membrane associated rhomboid family serine protease
MGAVGSVVWQAVMSPATTALLLGITWIWVKLYLQEWDQRFFTASFTDCVQKKQFWRVLLSPLSHNSFFILLLNATTLWNCRRVEQRHGTLFFLRYSVVLLLSESLLSFILIYFSMKLAPGRNAAVRQIICNLNTLGASGLALAWLCFDSFNYTDDTSAKDFQLLGMFNFQPSVAPLIMSSIYYLVLPRTHVYAHLSGLLSGYMLSLGFLTFLPGFYWSFCFYLNVALLTAASVFLPREMNAAEARAWMDEANDNFVEVENMEVSPEGVPGEGGDLTDILAQSDGPEEEGNLIRSQTSPTTPTHTSHASEGSGSDVVSQLEEGLNSVHSGGVLRGNDARPEGLSSRSRPIPIPIPIPLEDDSFA